MMLWGRCLRVVAVAAPFGLLLIGSGACTKTGVEVASGIAIQDVTVEEDVHDLFMGLFIANGVTGIRDTWGDLSSVEPGKVADLVLLEKNPLEEISNTREILAVMVKGQLLDRAKLDGILAEAEVPHESPVESLESYLALDSFPLPDLGPSRSTSFQPRTGVEEIQ